MYNFDEASQVLLYREPANGWFAALPTGNGHIGGMIRGGARMEIVDLNEDSCYWGKPEDRNVESAAEVFPEVRKLIYEGRVGEADERFHAGMNAMPRYVRPYVPLCALALYQWTGGRADNAEQYERTLDLRDGVVRSQYMLGGVSVRRTAFTSFENDVFAYRYEADSPITVNAIFNRRPYDDGAKSVDDRAIKLCMQLGEGGLRFCVMLRAAVEGEGARVSAPGGTLLVENARAITFYVAATTTWYQEDPEAYCAAALERAVNADFRALLSSNTARYQADYNRLSVSLGDEARADIETRARIERQAQGANDAALDALMFNYARYLLISCSQPGTQAANLQGIWNGQMVPPWDSNYTLNINLQMNYWMADAANLSRLREPEFDLFERMREKGRDTARKVFGANGFMSFHNVDMFGDSAPAGLFLPGAQIWPMGHVWSIMDMWYMYEFNPDDDFLREKLYPMFREACLFFRDFLIEDEDGHLITSFSSSPENPYTHAVTGQVSQNNRAPTFDAELLRDLFGTALFAVRRLEINDDLTAYLEEALQKLPPFKVGSKGQLLEWDMEHKENVPGMGHKSHLYAFYPSNQIRRDEPLAEAVKRSLQLRREYGRMSGHWPDAWSSCLWARFGDAETALKYYRSVEKGTTPNLFTGRDQCFQIDANLGAGAAFLEMLLQSHEDAIEPLPALPDSWKNGEIRGVRARGGFSLDFRWTNKTIDSLAVTSLYGKPLALRLDAALKPAAGNLQYENGCWRGETKKGETIRFSRA